MDRTLYDLISRILDSRDAYGDQVSMRRAARAAIWGAQQVVTRHSWSGYYTTLLATMQPPVGITASITANGVGTLTTGVLPDWASTGSIKLEDRYHPITALTTTTFQVSEYSAGAVASGSLELVHNRIPLRDEIRRLHHVRNEITQQDLILSGQDAYRERAVWNTVSSEPTTAGVFRESIDGITRFELRLLPAPSVETKIRMEYERSPHAPSLSHDCGLVGIDSNDNSATLENALTNTAFSHAQSGRMVLLVSIDENPPDADFGFTLGNRHEPQDRWNVTAVPSRTELTLEGTVYDAEGQSAILTHLLDIPGGTWEAAAMFAEAKYMQIGEGSVGDFWQTIKMAEAELRQAMENEAKIRQPENAFQVRGSVYLPPERID